MRSSAFIYSWSDLLFVYMKCLAKSLGGLISLTVMKIKLLKEENIKCEDIIVQLEKKLREMTNDLQSKDVLIKMLEESNKDLKKKTEDIKVGKLNYWN